jgi:hypothetical protein
MKSNRKREIHVKLQIQLILSQLAALRRQLRETLHAYEARLEISLAETISYVTGLKTVKRLRRERIDHIDQLIVLLRNHKLKPDKGRRKDLRRVEQMITEIRATLPGS